jgi:predicted cation transporter
MFKISGGLLLAAVLMLNALLAAFLYSDTLPDDTRGYFIDGIGLIIIFVCIVVILPLLYYRYGKRHSYDDLLHKMQKMGLRTQTLYYSGALVYLISSVVSTIGYALYRGGGINGWW